MEAPSYDENRRMWIRRKEKLGACAERGLRLRKFALFYLSVIVASWVVKFHYFTFPFAFANNTVRSALASLCNFLPSPAFREYFSLDASFISILYFELLEFASVVGGCAAHPECLPHTIVCREIQHLLRMFQPLKEHNSLLLKWEAIQRVSGDETRRVKPHIPFL